MTGLLAEKTYACATVRQNRVGLPEGMKKRRKLKQGEHTVFQKDKMLVTVWHDKRDVLFLSTNNSHTMDHVDRNDKR